LGIYSTGNLPFTQKSDPNKGELLTFTNSSTGRMTTKIGLEHTITSFERAVNKTITHGYTLEGAKSLQSDITQWRIAPPGQQFKRESYQDTTVKLPNSETGRGVARSYLPGMNTTLPANALTSKFLVKRVGNNPAVGVNVDEKSLDDAWRQVSAVSASVNSSTVAVPSNSSASSLFGRISAACQNIYNGTAEYLAQPENSDAIDMCATMAAGLVFSTVLQKSGLMLDGNSSVPSIGFGGKSRKRTKKLYKRNKALKRRTIRNKK
jgi:hypothetical protein